MEYGKSSGLIDGDDLLRRLDEEDAAKEGRKSPDVVSGKRKASRKPRVTEADGRARVQLNVSRECQRQLELLLGESLFSGRRESRGSLVEQAVAMLYRKRLEDIRRFIG